MHTFIYTHYVFPHNWLEMIDEDFIHAEVQRVKQNPNRSLMEWALHLQDECHMPFILDLTKKKEDLSPPEWLLLEKEIEIHTYIAINWLTLHADDVLLMLKAPKPNKVYVIIGAMVKSQDGNDLPPDTYYWANNYLQVIELLLSFANN